MIGTGLVEAEVRKLAEAQKRELAAWTLAKCGGEDHAPFLPNAIRWLPLEQRLALAGDVNLDVAFEELERRRVAEGCIHPVRGIWVPGWTYFTEAYGHLRPPLGPAIPFDFWETRTGYQGQLEVSIEIREWLRQVWLKARQLGMTWLALHDAFHLLAFDPETPLAKVLALSKHGGDASKLIARARRIRDLLPPFLRPEEATDSRRSNTRFAIAGRGDMTSLAGTPDAARSETATLLLGDEFGFIRNRQAGPTWTAAQPTLGEEGRAILLSTGNGPAEVPGDGQAFAELVGKAMGPGPIKFVFLPASTDPKRRSAAWREDTRDTYLSDEEFEAEHPETVEQALQGQPGTKLYPPAGIAAAERLGAALDVLRERGELAPPAEPVRATIPAIDWGEQTHGLLLYPLERGGFYYVAEVVHAHRDPEELVEPLLGGIRSLELGPVGPAHFDAAGVQSMRSFLATARRSKWPRLKSVSVPFGNYKREAIVYQRRLYRRARAIVKAADAVSEDLVDLMALGWPTIDELGGAEAVADALDLEGEIRELAIAGDRPLLPPLTGFAAVSPACAVFLRQTRGLEFADDDAGKVEKGDDHGPDAGLAGIAPTARRFRADVVADEAAAEDRAGAPA